MASSRSSLIVLTGALLLAAVGCGGGSSGEEANGRPTVAVTTTVLGDVVSAMVGDRAEVVVLMGPGADPHDVALSARQAAELREADALVTNGAGFEEGMLGGLETAEADGVPTHRAIEAVDTLTLAGAPTDGSGDGVDPHFSTDPDRMAQAAEGIASFLAVEVPALDDEAFRDAAATEVAALRALADEVEETLAGIPTANRVLVTDHEVLTYFADRYRFTVIGAVVPGGGTGGAPSARALADLAEVIDQEGVPAIFVDAAAPAGLAEALADEVDGEVAVVPLYAETLGPDESGAETYDEMLRTDAERIAEALG